MKKLIYLDNAATTKTSEEVVAAMLPYFTEYYGNPSSVYEFASESKKCSFKCKKNRLQRLWEHRKTEIYFTAGGSEADNWALKATAEAYQSKGKPHHHDQDRASCDPAYRRISGKTVVLEITYIGVDENGVVKVDELEKGNPSGYDPDLRYVCKQ